ncbi:MAG: cold shock domain-containing protein [Ilumatobacteraceae bacterium]
MPTGRVIDFDRQVGLGHVEDGSGAVRFFHCVEIVDGTRTIDVGAEVEFDVVVKFGAEEAAALRPRA